MPSNRRSVALPILELVLFFSLVVPGAVAQRPSPADLQRLEFGLEKERQRRELPGLSVAAFSRGEIVYRRNLGWASVELKAPITDESVFEIASITKQFTAVVTLQLRDEGMLELDDLLGTHLSGIPARWSGVTIRHLLSHTSGIPDYEAIMGYQGYRNEMALADVMSLVESRPLEFEPGERFAYCNTGYYLLSKAIEAMEDTALSQVFARRIFEPLGMSNTSLAGAETIVPGRVQGYARVDGRLENRDATRPSSTLGAGAILSTVEDMAKWDHALYGERLLSEETKGEMWTPAVLNDGTELEYALGWRVEPYLGITEQYHYGMAQGMRSVFVRMPDQGISIVVFHNRYLGKISDLAKAMMHTFNPELP